MFKFLAIDIISAFSLTLSNIMSTSLNVLQMPLVKNALNYSRALALSLLAVKTMYEAFQTYILYQAGDPDADPGGLIIRTAQAVAVIVCCPFIIEKVFEWGTNVSTDISIIGNGATNLGQELRLFLTFYMDGGTVLTICCIIILICIIIISIQAAIRGAELALMSILGPILALNITSYNRSAWSSYFKQLIIICTSQALQIFMLQGVLALLISKSSLLAIIGWLWVTIKTPKWIQQFTYSTGFTGTVGSGLKQATSMIVMRKVIK